MAIERATNLAASVPSLQTYSLTSLVDNAPHQRTAAHGRTNECSLSPAADNITLTRHLSPHAIISRSRWYPLDCFTVALASIWIFRSTVSSFFWHDDFQMIRMVQTNTLLDYLQYGFDTSIKIYGPIAPVWRPIPHYIYWWATWHLFGANPTGYHIVNLGIHALNSVLIYLAARRLLRSRPGALAAALVYLTAVTIQAEQMYWLWVVNDSLLTLFVLVAFLTYVVSRGSDARAVTWHAASVVSFLFACLSKESAIVLPALLAGYELVVLPNQPRSTDLIRTLTKRLWVYALISTALVFMRSGSVAQLGNGSSYYGYHLTVAQLSKYAWGAYWLFEPFVAPIRAAKSNLAPGLHSNHWITVAVVLAFGAAAALTILSRRRRRLARPSRLVIFASLWFLLAPAVVLFTGPFSAYLFMMAALGPCLLFGSLIAWVAPHAMRTLKAGAPVLGGVLAVAVLFEANLLEQVYARDAARTPHQIYLTQAVIDTVRPPGYNLPADSTLYVVGFPSRLFDWSEGEDDGRASDALRLFVGHPVPVVQVASLSDIPQESCASAVIETYDPMTDAPSFPTACVTGTLATSSNSTV